MRTTQIFLRSGLAVAAAAFPLTLAAPAAVAGGSGISVSTSGTTVSVTTSTCTSNGGSFGNASLLSSGQVNFSQGRQTSLTGSSSLQSALWSNVGAGTYTVVVVCANGTTAGTQAVVVRPSSGPAAPKVPAVPAVPAVPKIPAVPKDPAVPLITAPSAPARGVLGGLGGASRDYRTVTLVGGGTLVVTGVVATAWFLRRRARPHRL